MNKVMIDLGIVQINWYSFFIFLAMATAAFLVFKESKKKNLNQDTLVDIMFYALIFGILGARTYYVLFNLDYYLSNPLEIIQIWKGGLAIHGGILAGLMVIIYYSKKQKLKLPLLTDIIVPGLIIGQAIGRWGNFFNQEAFGRIVKLSTLENMYLPKFIIEGMHINGFYREPTFLYESVMSLIGFIVLALYIILCCISSLTVMSVVGNNIWTKVFKKEENIYLSIVIGIVVFKLVYLVPIIGGLLSFASILIGLGYSKELMFPKKK